MKKTKTAILVFALSAKTDALKKVEYNATPVFETLNTAILKKVEQTGLPFFVSNETTQHGYTFGERYANAIKSVFTKGYDNVITIGNDTPQLTSKTLIEASKKVSSNQVVLGPSTDGGFYLFGFNNLHFNTELFVNLPWQTSLLASDLCKKIDAEIIKLSPLKDVDSIEDIKYFCSARISISPFFVAAAKFLLNLKRCAFNHSTRLIKIVVTANYFNKGSPVLN